MLLNDNDLWFCLEQQQRVVHRDLKAENVLIAEDGTAKLCDFGLAHMFDGDNDQLSGLWGTRAYQAPECFGDEAYSGRASDSTFRPYIRAHIVDTLFAC